MPDDEEARAHVLARLKGRLDRLAELLECRPGSTATGRLAESGAAETAEIVPHRRRDRRASVRRRALG